MRRVVVLGFALLLAVVMCAPAIAHHRDWHGGGPKPPVEEPPVEETTEPEPEPEPPNPEPSSLRAACAPGGSTSRDASGLDPLQHHTLTKLWNFSEWLEEGDACGFVGETNVPNERHDRVTSDEEQQKWNTLNDMYYEEMNDHNIWATNYTSDERQRYGGFWLSTYINRGDGKTRAISQPMAQAEVVEKHPSTEDYLRGTNLSSAQEWLNPVKAENAGENPHSNVNPGEYDKEYWYPGLSDDPYTGENSYEYLASTGMDTIRLPFRWERLQPALGEPFRERDADALEASLDAAADANMKVILSIQNYGYYTVGDPNDLSTVDQRFLGEDLPDEAYLDLVKRLSERYGDHEAYVALDLMNEPNFGEGNAGSKALYWEQLSQKAVQTMRASGSKQWAIADMKLGAHKKPWLDDPYTAYTIHHYFGFGGDGLGGPAQYARSYDENVQMAEERGF